MLRSTLCISGISILKKQFLFYNIQSLHSLSLRFAVLAITVTHTSLTTTNHNAYLPHLHPSQRHRRQHCHLSPAQPRPDDKDPLPSTRQLHFRLRRRIYLRQLLHHRQEAYRPSKFIPSHTISLYHLELQNHPPKPRPRNSKPKILTHVRPTDYLHPHPRQRPQRRRQPRARQAAGRRADYLRPMARRSRLTHRRRGNRREFHDEEGREE